MAVKSRQTVIIVKSVKVLKKIKKLSRCLSKDIKNKLRKRRKDKEIFVFY